MTQGARDRRRAETHRRLYQVAMQLFEERGFDKVSVGEIVAAAGVSVPTFYAHFPSKDRIVLQVADHDELVRLLEVTAPAPSVTEHVERVIDAWLSAFDGEAREELLRQWRLVGRTRSLQLKAAEIERDAAAVVIEHLDHARCDSAALAVQLTILSLFAASTQILMRWAAGDGRRPLGEVRDHVLGVLRSLATDPV